MASILERALAPLLIAFIWLVAIFMLARGGTALTPLLAGLIGGIALILQDCASGAREPDNVFWLRDAAVASLALLIFVAGIAFAFAFDPETGRRQIFEIASIPMSALGFADAIMRAGYAIAVAALIGNLGRALIEDAP